MLVYFWLCIGMKVLLNQRSFLKVETPARIPRPALVTNPLIIMGHHQRKGGVPGIPVTS